MKHPENNPLYPGLSVSPAPVAAPPAVNPRYTRPARPVLIPTPEDIRSGNPVALSHAITLTESRRPDHQAAAARLLTSLLPYSGRARRIGITGTPGAGKSTTIEALGLALLEAAPAARLAVLAIDPSSARTHGAILGDKTRMPELAAHPRAFIRPTPSSCTLGGVARYTRQSIPLLEAAGFNLILIETVGVGQSETSIRSLADLSILIQIPGAGDELQGIKRGVMEIADAILVNNRCIV